MHRQSLGSPSSKLHHGGIILLKDETSSSTTPSFEDFSPVIIEEEEEEEEENIKKLKPRTEPAEIYIHFIPMLTLLCLLILYLSSHNPNQIDVAEFDGYKHLSDSGDMINDIQKSNKMEEIRHDGTLAVVSLKNRRFLRRKMADF